MDKQVTQTVTIKQTPAERKEELMRDGEFFRAGVAHAKAQIRHGARPEVLFHSAVDHATYAVRSRVDSLLHPTGVSMSSIAPYALTAIKFIRHRKLGKPALAIGVLLGVAGWYWRHRQAQQVVETPTTY
jgi:C4-dicarboxylate-specific signal transduction histidine kinase